MTGHLHYVMNRSAADEYAAKTGAKIMKAHNMSEMIKFLHEGGHVVARLRQASAGFNLPDGTTLTFSEDCQESGALRQQAEARVHRKAYKLYPEQERFIDAIHNLPDGFKVNFGPFPLKRDVPLMGSSFTPHFTLLDLLPKAETQLKEQRIELFLREYAEQASGLSGYPLKYAVANGRVDLGETLSEGMVKRIETVLQSGSFSAGFGRVIGDLGIQKRLCDPARNALEAAAPYLEKLKDFDAAEASERAVLGLEKWRRSLGGSKPGELVLNADKPEENQFIYSYRAGFGNEMMDSVLSNYLPRASRVIDESHHFDKVIKKGHHFERRLKEPVTHMCAEREDPIQNFPHEDPFGPTDFKHENDKTDEPNT